MVYCDHCHCSCVWESVGFSLQGIVIEQKHNASLRYLRYFCQTYTELSLLQYFWPFSRCLCLSICSKCLVAARLLFHISLLLCVCVCVLMCAWFCLCMCLCGCESSIAFVQFCVCVAIRLLTKFWFTTFIETFRNSQFLERALPVPVGWFSSNCINTLPCSYEVS
jgi:hypothetical protein